LPNSIEDISSYAFANNSISTVNIPSSVIYVFDGAFEGNPLTNVKLNNLDVEIGCAAFGDPNEITTHNLPESYEYNNCPA